jgi:hypothetical protein
MSGHMTTQQFLIRDIDARAARLRAEPGVDARDAERQQRSRYAAVIARFSKAAERDSEEGEMARRRYAKIMAMDSGYHLRAALSMLRQGQALTGAEVAAIVIGAEHGEAITGAVRMLINAPQQLPAPEVADEIRAYVLASDSPAFSELRRALQH